ncbi:MAG: pyrroloquinoline quinone biosynthesis protein PqqB [Bacteroidetes bacterium]|nr:MAG: pyrroloquinoline quinone biosynthesis protein PqqB [Bacteroidota bacterium]
MIKSFRSLQVAILLLGGLLGISLFLPPPESASPYILVLGIAQDAGYPQIACTKSCCETAKLYPEKKRMVSSLALMDAESKKWWLLDATPDIAMQLELFHDSTRGAYPYLPEGIVLTHAHMGHYTGLMQLGREALNAKSIPVYCLPRLANFLEHNGPWDQLVKLKNIQVKVQDTTKPFALGPFLLQLYSVPHRDEYSETAGIHVHYKDQQALFIPDIDKWEKWNRSLPELLKQVDLAFLDATFFSEGELPGRNMKEIPHPFIQETMQLIDSFASDQASKIHFIHLNHSNPLLWNDSVQGSFRTGRYGVAEQGVGYGY